MTYVSKLVRFATRRGHRLCRVRQPQERATSSPYLLKSTDAGKTWTIHRRRPAAARHGARIAEDHVDPKLLFCGTEFGLYFTLDGGKKWHRLKNGLPTIAVRDLGIQRSMSDLVIATFGRGFYVLDDYSPLRNAGPHYFDKPAAILPVRDAFLFMPRDQFGGRGKASLGAAFYTASNPPFGATFTYFLKDALPTKKQKRKEAAKGRKSAYPSLDELRAEAEEEEPAVIVTIADADGTPIQVFTGPSGAGVHRVTWDLRLPGPTLPRQAGPRAPDEDFPRRQSNGPLALPGKYQVTISKRVDGVVTRLAGPVDFSVRYVGPKSLSADEWKALAAFQRQALRLERDLNAAMSTAGELANRLEQIKTALDNSPKAPAEARQTVRKLIDQNREIQRKLRGDSFLEARWENTPVSIADRVGTAAAATRTIVDKPTGTEREQLKIARSALDEQSAKLRQLKETDVKQLERLLDKLVAPWTPGRLPPAGK